MTADTHPLRAAAPPATWKRRTSPAAPRPGARPLLARPGFSLALVVVLFALLAALAPHWLTSFDPYAHVARRQATGP